MPDGIKLTRKSGKTHPENFSLVKVSLWLPRAGADWDTPDGPILLCQFQFDLFRHRIDLGNPEAPNLSRAGGFGLRCGAGWAALPAGHQPGAPSWYLCLGVGARIRRWLCFGRNWTGGEYTLAQLNPRVPSCNLGQTPGHQVAHLMFCQIFVQAG